jgi:preprotein translocase subunit SecG
MVNSLALAKMAIMDRKEAKSIIESISSEHSVDRNHAPKKPIEAPIAK